MAEVRQLAKMMPRPTGTQRVTPGKSGTHVKSLGNESSGISGTSAPRRQQAMPAKQGNVVMLNNGNKLELISHEEALRRKGRPMKTFQNGQGVNQNRQGVTTRQQPTAPAEIRPGQAQAQARPPVSTTTTPAQVQARPAPQAQRSAPQQQRTFGVPQKRSGFAPPPPNRAQVQAAQRRAAGQRPAAVPAPEREEAPVAEAAAAEQNTPEGVEATEQSATSAETQAEAQASEAAPPA